jgi:pimeloyl-ACP methyl ester carboxylesterase
MKRCIGSRELITLAHNGKYVLGTYHRPRFESSDSSSDTAARNRVGILFLNPGVLPRAATGDSAVYWADSFAKLGYPCFRFDLPGLGDSEGDLPTEVLNFVNLVDDGTYVPLVSGLVKTLAQRFCLSGLIVVGHCAGAVSGLYAAAAGQNNGIKGLVLLDPYFHRRQGVTNRNLLSRWYRHIVTKREQEWDVSDQPVPQDARIRLFSYISSAYDRLKYIRRLVQGKRLPKNANVRLLECWDRLKSAGLPMLVLRAPGIIPKVGEFDYIRYLQSISSRGSRAVIRSIEGTTHSFVEGSGKEAVREHVEQWLGDCFSISEDDPNARPNTRVAVNA